MGTVKGGPGPEIPDERRLLDALRQGDEAAFARLVDLHHAAMVRLAMIWTHDRGVAEEVAQEAWVGLLRGLDGFEGRSSLKTYLFRIVANRARTRGVREARMLPLSALGGDDLDGPAVDPDRFLDAQRSRSPGMWAAPPESWAPLPESELLSRETLAELAAAIEALPAAQREVIRLRDVEGWSAEEVCDALELTQGNQRVLLHRARSKVRAALEQRLGETS